MSLIWKEGTADMITETERRRAVSKNSAARPWKEQKEREEKFFCVRVSPPLSISSRCCCYSARSGSCCLCFNPVSSAKYREFSVFLCVWSKNVCVCVHPQSSKCERLLRYSESPLTFLWHFFSLFEVGLPQYLDHRHLNFIQWSFILIWTGDFCHLASGLFVAACFWDRTDCR